MNVPPRLVTGHDFRSYSASIKNALINGLMAAGIEVHDIGLALSPMAYFAQFELDVPAVAMVTASSRSAVARSRQPSAVSRLWFSSGPGEGFKVLRSLIQPCSGAGAEDL